ncbi:unnamed protein product [Musa acuminata subsp. burmannicoides]
MSLVARGTDDKEVVVVIPMASSPPSAGAPPPSTPPPPPVAKKGFFRRVLPFFLAANLGIGAYVLIKQLSEKNNEAEEQVTAPATPTESAVTEKKSVVVPTPAPIKVLPPIPEQEQRQLFKWILEEKRKVKPSDPTEKKKLDEEKALLKQFIRAKSVPSL